jgi:hypothetical protein
MTLEFLSTLTLGALIGGAIGCWRTWAFARKLIHMGVGLDQWSDYCEATMQAHGGQARARRGDVTALRRNAEAADAEDKASDVPASAAGVWASLKLRAR